MTQSGDFSREAYEQLKDAYANQLTTQDEQELAGRTVLGQNMSLETLPVDSPWRSRTEDWQYPNGKSAYMDGKQSPEEILEIMRQSVMEKQEPEAEEEMTEEELDAILDEILEGDDQEEEEDEDEDEDEEVGEADESEESYEVEDEDEEEDEEEEEEEDEEETTDPEEVAEQIAALKDQIEAFRFANISDEDLEE
jgi:hypothetical protein